MPENILDKLVPIQLHGSPVPAIAPLPPSQDTTPDQLSIFYRPSPIPYVRHSPIPPQGSASGNAAINSGATAIVNKAIAKIPVPVAAAPVGDGLIHGDAIWWLDPAFTFFREDFLESSVIGGSGNFQSEHLWFFNGLVAYTFQSWVSSLTGAVAWSTPNGAGVFGLMMPQTMGVPSGNTCANYWPLFEYPGWKFVFVFGFNVGSALTEANNPAPTFSAAQTSFYIGLGNQPATNNYTTSPRLPFFCGLRFDTDPGNGASETVSLTNVSAAGGGFTTYTGSFGAAGNSDNLAGITFIIAGFANAGNNGTFRCVNSTSTTINLVNAGGVIEAHAATAIFIPLGDTTMHFECVSNSLNTNSTARNNTQGTVFDTGLTPTLGATYRLEIECLVAGTVQFTLVNGSVKSSTTMVMPQWVWSSGGFQYRSDGQQAYIKGIYNSAAINNPMAVGSVAFMSGSGQTSIDGTRTVVAAVPHQFNFLTNSTITQTLVPAGAITGYPAMAPFAAFGNDNTNTPTTNRSQFFLDFVSFVRNPGVGGGTGTPNPLLPRYF